MGMCDCHTSLLHSSLTLESNKHLATANRAWANTLQPIRPCVRDEGIREMMRSMDLGCTIHHLLIMTTVMTFANSESAI